MPVENKTAAGETISMRHSKLTASEAAILAGELNKPSWQSRNEGIHERVSFEDAIWGFDLAGGSYYKTPLRVTAVKPESRAEKAGIRPGDRLLRINDIDTSTLTIQEAHEIIVESGIHLKIAVTAPDDEEDSYHCWEDPFDQGYDSEEERRKQQEKIKKREIHAKVSSYWSLQWPWVSKRRVIYRESNCFMVPSKYEDNHREKFPIQPVGPKVPDDIVLHSVIDENEPLTTATPLENLESNSPKMTNGNTKPSEIPVENKIAENTENNSNDVKDNESAKDSTPNPVKINGTTEVIDESKVTEDTQSNGHDTNDGDHSVMENETVEQTTEELVTVVESSESTDIKDDSDQTEIKENGINGIEDKSESDVLSVQENDLIEEVIENGINEEEDDKILSEILSDGEINNDDTR